MKRFIAMIAMVTLIFTGISFTSAVPEVEASSTGQLIVINKSINRLAFFENGKIVKTFTVATGKTNELTPEGRFPIVNKIKNRPYYTDNIPGGDPRNPLGDRWLGLDARGTYGTTYAIHGNSDESSIGKYVSAGCVRMHNESIRWLFDRIKVQTDAVIVSSSKSFEQIAADYGYKTGQQTKPIKMLIDGQNKTGNSAPFMRNNRVLVPMRSVFNALGATVVWDAKTKSITASKNGEKIELKVDSKRATINGKVQMLDVAPTVQNGVTYVPTRFVSEALGASVKWNGKTNTVSLTSPPKPKPPVKPAEPEKKPINVMLNGKKLDEEAFIMDGVSMVSVRSVFNWLDVPFSYKDGTVKANDGKGTIVVSEGKKVAQINGANVTLPAAPMIHKGKMYVPVRAVTEAFQGTVQLKGTTLHIGVKEK